MVEWWRRGMTARCSRWSLGARAGAGVGWVWWSGCCEEGMESVSLRVQLAFADGIFENFKFMKEKLYSASHLEDGGISESL